METLTLCEFADQSHPFAKSLNPDETLSRRRDLEPLPELEQRFMQLGLSEIDLGFAGSNPEKHAIHQHLAELKCGDLLKIEKQHDGRIMFTTNHGHPVCRGARSFSFEHEAEQIEVAAILLRNKSDQDEAYQGRCKVDRWAVVVPRIVYFKGQEEESH